MITTEALHDKRAAILAVAAKYGASNVRVFGSVARGEAGPNSDVDLLVDLEPGRTLFDLARLSLELEDLLGSTVDVALARTLRPRVREATQRDIIPL